MENLLLIILVFVTAIFAILAFVVVRNERDKEIEGNLTLQPQIFYRGIHVDKVQECEIYKD
jgi:hypothetical protein